MCPNQRPKPAVLSLLGPGTRGHGRDVGRTVVLLDGPLQLLKECAGVLGTDLRGKQRIPIEWSADAAEACRTLTDGAPF